MTKGDILKAIKTADNVYAYIKMTTDTGYYLTLSKKEAAKIVRLTPCGAESEYLATYNPGPDTNTLYLN